MIINILQGICAIASLICFVLIVIQMFQNGETGMGIACIVLIFCGIGGLVAFVYGWVKSGAWGTQTIMMIWSACIAGAIVFAVLGGVMAPAG